jgi:hypothetical protein
MEPWRSGASCLIGWGTVVSNLMLRMHSGSVHYAWFQSQSQYTLPYMHPYNRWYSTSMYYYTINSTISLFISSAPWRFNRVSNRKQITSSKEEGDRKSRSRLQKSNRGQKILVDRSTGDHWSVLFIKIQLWHGLVTFSNLSSISKSTYILRGKKSMNLLSSCG